MRSKPLQIIPSSPLSKEEEPFWKVIQATVKRVLPPALQRALRKGTLKPFLQALPILKHSWNENTLTVTLLCQGEYTQGVGRYFFDALCRWLVPGMNLNVIGNIALCFRLTQFPTHKIYLNHAHLVFDDPSNMETASQNLPSLLDEIKINILAVYQARYIASIKSLSIDQKKRMIEDNLQGILNLSSKEADSSLFDEMHRFLLKVSEEEKIGQIQHTLAHLQQKRPKLFDRQMFYDMTHFAILFKDHFISKRSPRYISRIIAIFYLFKKQFLAPLLSSQGESSPLLLRWFKTNVDDAGPVLSLLLGLNQSKKSDRIKELVLMEAIRAILPEAVAVTGSYFADRRGEKMAFFYLEICKRRGKAFSSSELKLLRQHTEQEILKRLEGDAYSVFLPRNEEDFARNLIVLSQQLKRQSDLPQVSIHFDRQTENELYFSLFLARLLQPTSRDLRELFLQDSKKLKFSIDELRKIGMLRHKIHKEAAVLQVSMEKASFFRGDFSIDLLRARQKIADELNTILGPYRDFNGGMILRQEEALRELTHLFVAIDADTKCLLENYFYSLKPGVMQTVLPPEILKMHFEMLLTLQAKGAKDPSLFLEKRTGTFSLFFAKLPSHSSFKEYLNAEIEKLQIPSYELAGCSLPLPFMGTLGYVLQTESELLAQSFKQALQRALEKSSYELLHVSGL
jgi:hypothetical protein